MIEIDGSYGEAGGQIIRTSLTLSAITQKPVRITNIRAGRPNPGLQPQHLMSCKAVRNVCRGTLSHCEIGSTELDFEPGPIVGGKYDFDIGTAGSVTLVAQTILPILFKAAKPSSLKITGGTHVMKSPSADYFERVFVPAIGEMGAKMTTKLVRIGYYPRGGGVLGLEVAPSSLAGIVVWPHDEQIRAIIRYSGLPEGVAIREKKIFVQNGIERDIFIRQDEALSIGNAVTAWKGLIGSYSLGEKGKRAETVAQEALDAIKIEKGDVDKHLADQLLIYGALAEGKTSYQTSEITEHLKTNAYIISHFVDRKIGLDKENGKISVD